MSMERVQAEFVRAHASVAKAVARATSEFLQAINGGFSRMQTCVGARS